MYMCEMVIQYSEVSGDVIHFHVHGTENDLNYSAAYIMLASFNCSTQSVLFERRASECNTEYLATVFLLTSSHYSANRSENMCSRAIIWSDRTAISFITDQNTHHNIQQ